SSSAATAGSSVLALGPNQLGSGGGGVKPWVLHSGASLEASHPPVVVRAKLPDQSQPVSTEPAADPLCGSSAVPVACPIERQTLRTDGHSRAIPRHADLGFACAAM